MYNVELYDRTACRVITSQKSTTDTEASKTVREYINRVKEKHRIVKESNFDISPRGFVFGQTLHSVNAVFDITTARI